MFKLGEFFTRADLERLLAELSIEAENTKHSNAKFKLFLQELDDAKQPFRVRQKALLKEKQLKDPTAVLTVDELDAIWQPFRIVQRRIEKMIFSK